MNNVTEELNIKQEIQEENKEENNMEDHKEFNNTLEQNIDIALENSSLGLAGKL